MTTLVYSADIHAQPTNPIPHEELAYTFGDGVGTTIGCGDVGILHNIAIVLKSKKCDDKYADGVNKFHIAVRTMRRSTHWDWVRPIHIQYILAFCEEIHNNIEVFQNIFKDASQHFLEVMETSVEAGAMTEADYLLLANGMKQPHNFITSSEFKDWIKCRATFYKSLKGKLPNVCVRYMPTMNEHDGKLLFITNPDL